MVAMWKDADGKGGMAQTIVDAAKFSWVKWISPSQKSLPLAATVLQWWLVTTTVLALSFIESASCSSMFIVALIGCV